MAATIINRQIEASISDCEAAQEKLAKEQAALTKKMATFQKKLASAIKRSENCKKYIASLLQEERIVSIHSDEKVLSGPVAGSFYVRSDSLNAYGADCYYIANHHTCSCDARGKCKHVEALAARLSDGEKASKFASLKAQYDCRKPVALQGAAWEVIGAERIRANMIKWVFGGLNETVLTVLNRHPEASWWIEQDKKHIQFAEMLSEEVAPTRKTTSVQRQEAVLAGASRGFSLLK